MLKMILDNDLALFFLFMLATFLMVVGAFAIDRATRTSADICEGAMLVLKDTDRTPEIFIECLKIQGGKHK